MKLHFFTTYYPPFLTQFYSSHPNFNYLSFAEMQQLLLNQHFADTGAAFHFSKAAGNEAFITIANCEALQKKWAQENDFVFSDSNWAYEIALAQIKFFKPEVFFIESIFEYYGAFIAAAKQYCKRIAAWISTPYNNSLNLANIDLILSSTPTFVEGFRKQGIASEYLLPAFDARVLQHLDANAKKDIPFSFIGGWSHVHVIRKKIISQLAATTPIQIWGYGFKQTFSKRSLSYYKDLLFPENKVVLKAYKGEAWGLDMYKILNRSLITFNIHESLLQGRVGNMRMFEATGAGTLLLNDMGTNLAELFVPDKEIVVYNSVDEAIEKMNYLLAHPEKAIEIGKNAQLRTLKDYNYEIYIAQLTAYFTKIGKQ